MLGFAFSRRDGHDKFDREGPGVPLLVRGVLPSQTPAVGHRRRQRRRPLAAHGARAPVLFVGAPLL